MKNEFSMTSTWDGIENPREEKDTSQGEIG